MIHQPRRFFPNPQLALSDGLVAMSDELSIELLKESYSWGIFPWPHEDSPILWFSPDPRGILDFSEFHLSKSFKKFLRTCEWEVRWNTQFDQVIENCAFTQRKGETGTWITEHLMNYYKKFHRAGFAHSLEIWEQDKLIGGIYGVFVEGSFSGESMFFHKSPASKVALTVLVIELEKIGLKWMDIQMVTPNLKAFGGRYIKREMYYKRLAQAQAQKNLLKPLSPRSASVSRIVAAWTRNNVQK
ncbi:MAG: leucyl/phenylalanyl-tRNA--protein transferase [Bdellovibrionales bacterium]|nr:leucyl/phenylalanyl-tRNA--protein transferase [Bdellovibrionales bacterium]